MERLKKLITSIRGFEGPLSVLDNIEIDNINYEIMIREEKIIIVVNIYNKYRDRYVFHKTLDYTPNIFEIVKEWKIWELGIRTEVSQKEIERIIFELEFLQVENNKNVFTRSITDFIYKLDIKKVEIYKKEDDKENRVKFRIIEEYNYPVVIEYKNLIFKFDAKEKIAKFDKLSQIQSRTFKIENLIRLERYFRKEVEIDEIWEYIR